MSKIALGTSSWHFDAWRGVFYPEKLAKKNLLGFYSRQFSTVEVNTSFYAIPRAATVVNWIEAVPPDFSFCLKFPRLITHEKCLQGCEEETRVFLEVLRSMGAAAAPAFLQFPASFSRRTHGRQLADYLDWLAPQAEGVRLAVEVRAADLATEAFAAFLADRGFALVLVDRIHTADLFPVWHALVEAQRTPPFCIIRWIGDDKNGPTGDREIALHRDDDLARWAQRMARLHDAGIDVYGYMHNPYEGHSPATIRRLQAQLMKHLDLPAWDPPPFSVQKEEEGGQLSLFQ